jgi:hypothetical protein
MLRRIKNVILPAILAILIGGGCQTYSDQARKMDSAWAAGQLGVAADRFGKEAETASAGDAVIWRLEAGAAYRAITNYPASGQHFDVAATKMDAYEEQAKVKVGHETLALMSNQQNLPYEGRAYDKIMLHTYAALNYLAVGEVDKARPEIIRAYQCQQDAVDANKRNIEKAQQSEKESKDHQTIERSRSNPRFASALGDVTNNTEGFQFYADYVNPFTVYLDGLYFMHAGVDASDLERARKSLKRVQEATPGNKFVMADLRQVEARIATASGKPAEPCTYVIFETGCAASREQKRIDVPIVFAKLSYVGMAFPKLVYHKDFARALTVQAGNVTERTELVANMDAIIALDFQNEWPTILSKTLVSAVAKAAANYLINQSAERRSPWLGLLSRVTTTVTEIAMNIADTRSWTTLPKEFQVARIATPANRKLLLSVDAAVPPVEVALVPGTVNVVYVKSIHTNARLLITQFKLQ